MTDMIDIITVPVRGKMQKKQVSSDWKNIAKEIQADYVEMVRIGNYIDLQPYVDNDISVVMFVDETGAIDRDEPNYFASMLYGFPVNCTVIHGNAILCGFDVYGRGDLVSIPEKFNDIGFWETKIKDIEKL